MDYAYRILAVDDEPDILRTNRRYLEAQGYQVDTAACASEALEHLKNQNYDAILLDVLLPGFYWEFHAPDAALHEPQFCC